MEPESGSSNNSRPWLLKYRSSQGFILFTVCAATFTDGFVYGVLVPLLPISLQVRYNVDLEDVQTWVSGLLGTFGAFVLIGSPIVGWISDAEKSRKSEYLFGLSCLLGGITMLAIPQLWMLIISRILQGISAAVIFTVGLALVADTVDPKDIGYYMGYALSAMGCGVLLGPFFGSITFNSGGHFAVVALVGGIAIVDIILRLLMIEKTVARKFEPPRDACAENTRLLPPPPPPTEDYQKNSKPSKPKWKTFTLLSNPRVATALYGVFVHVVIIASFDAVLPIFLEQVFGRTSLNVALCFLAIAIPDTFLGPVVGMLSDTVGPMLPALFGCVLTAILMTLLQLIDHNSSAQIWLLFILFAFTGAASPLIISPLAADLFYVVETLSFSNDELPYAQSYSLFTCSMAAGTLIGPVLSGFLIEKYGWTVLCWTLGIFILSGAIPIYVYTGRTKDCEQ